MKLRDQMRLNIRQAMCAQQLSLGELSRGTRFELRLLYRILITGEASVSLETFNALTEFLGIPLDLAMQPAAAA